MSSMWYHQLHVVMIFSQMDSCNLEVRVLKEQLDG